MLRRLPSAAIGALALSVLGATSLAQPALADAAAPGQLQAEITSPAASANVTGQVTVTVHLTGDGTTTPTRAMVTIASVATPAESRSASVDNLDPSCATACDVVVTVDTMSWQDPGDDPNAVPTMLDNGQATIDATVDADTANGPVTASAPQLSVNATGRATLMRLYDPNDIQVYQGSGTAYYSIQQPPAAQDHLALTIFGNGYHRDLTMAPQVSGDYVNYTVPIDMTGQLDGMYWLRAASVDVTGRTSTVSLSPLSVYSGPAVRAVTSLVAVNPATHNGHNVQMKLRINLMPTSNGPGGPGYGSFHVSLDGGFTQNPWLYTYDPATDIVSMLLDSNNHDALTTGAHTLAITYSQTITTDSYGNVIRTGTASWTGQVSSAGMSVSGTTPGPVFEGDPASQLRVTMTGVADTTGFVPRIAAWRVADWPTGGGVQLGTGTCSPSCATLTVTVPLSKLTGGYPGQNDGNLDHGLQILVTDDAGVARPFVVHVIVAAKAHVSLQVPSSAAYGSTVHLLTGVQETNGQMLPGVPVTFQAMTGGSNVWRIVGTGTTNNLGLVSAPVVMAYNTHWRAVVAQRAGYNSAGVSATFATAVPARAVLTGVPSSGYAYHGYTMATTVSPHSYGRLVYVLARKYGTTTWVTIAKPLTDSFGVARNTLKLARGTWYIRTVASGTLASATGYSATVTTVMR